MRKVVSALRLAPNAAKIDVLDLTYRLMMDFVTGYLFDKTYKVLEEQSMPSAHISDFPNAVSIPSKMSALPFIFALVNAGRFSLLPTWLYHVFKLYS